MLGTTRVKTIVVMAPWIGDKDDPASVQKGLCIPE
jgi:AmmeMemoRadiSam system protein B